MFLLTESSERMHRRLFLYTQLFVIVSSGVGSAAEPIVLTGGRIEVIDLARLASDQVGVLANKIPAEGARVEKDTIVAQLHDEIPRAALAAAEVLANSDANVRAKQNAAELALVDYQRAALANRRNPGTVAELEVRRLELVYRQALLEKEQAEKDLELNRRRRDQSQAVLRSYSIRAPFSGVVTQVFRAQGEAVRQGDPILELVNIERVRIALEVPLHVASQLRVGMKVTASPASGGTDQEDKDQADSSRTQLPGVITFIAPAAEQLSKSVRVHVIVDDNSKHRLVPGLEAVVSVPEGDKPE